MHIEKNAKRATEGVCCVCFEEDIRVLKQYHHVYGKANDADTVVILCENCHDKIIYDQNIGIPPSVRSSFSSKEDLKAYEDLTVGSLLEVIGQHMKRRARRKYGKDRHRSKSPH